MVCFEGQNEIQNLFFVYQHRSLLINLTTDALQTPRLVKSELK